MIRHGFYRRLVEDVHSFRREVSVQRFRCRGCGVTFSFPPAGVVRYKRYDAAVLGLVLDMVFGFGCSLGATLNGVLCSSYSSVRRWVRDFGRRSECIRCEGLGRLGLSWRDCERSPVGVWRRLRLLCDGEPGFVFDLVQGVFLSECPQVDVFLGVLRPD